MPIRIGSTPFIGAGKIRYGNNAVKAVYRGTDLIWPVDFRLQGNMGTTNLGYGIASAFLTNSWVSEGTLVGTVTNTGFSSGQLVRSTDAGSGWTITRNESGGMLDVIFTIIPYVSSGFGLNQFVAVGRGGRLRVSRDGNTWSNIDSTTGEHLWAVAEDPIFGRVVAVGHNQRIVHSAFGNLDNWSRATSDYPGNTLYDVCWGNNTFVAVGEGTTFMHSAAGNSWNYGTRPPLHPTNITLRSVHFGNGEFRAVADSGQTYLSTNGSGWSLGPTFSNGSSVPTKIRCINGLWYLTATTGTNVPSGIFVLINNQWMPMIMTSSLALSYRSMYCIDSFREGIIAAGVNTLVYGNF